CAPGRARKAARPRCGLFEAVRLAEEYRANLRRKPRMTRIIRTSKQRFSPISLFIRVIRVIRGLLADPSGYPFGFSSGLGLDPGGTLPGSGRGGWMGFASGLGGPISGRAVSGRAPGVNDLTSGL